MPPAEEPPSVMEDADDFAAESIEVTPLDVRPSTRRKPAAPRRRLPTRMFTVAATVAVVLAVAVGLFARVATNPAAALATLLPLPKTAPQPTFVPGANVVYLDNGAPWGTLTLDGRRLPQSMMLGAPITVARGTHTLVYQARYFPSVRCTFSAPVRRTDTCPMGFSFDVNQFVAEQGLARVFDLGSTGATLQRDQLDTLIALASTQLASQARAATIQPGDRYLDANGQIATASTPLRFTLALSLDQSETAGVPTAVCFQFCPDQNIVNGGYLYDQQWPMRIYVTSAWAITDANGAALTTSTYLSGQSFPVEVSVKLTPDGWQVTEAQDISVEATKQAAVQAVQQASSGVSVSPTLGANPLDGCVLNVTEGSDQAALFWRFGALLVWYGDASKRFQNLPHANSAEALAAKLIGR